MTKKVVELNRRVQHAEGQQQVLARELARLKRVHKGTHTRVLGEGRRRSGGRRAGSRDQGDRRVEERVEDEAKWRDAKVRHERLFKKPLDELAEEWGLQQGKRVRSRADTV